MYYHWLDHWDEKKALQGDASKQASEFILGSEHLYEASRKVTSIETFCDLAEQTVFDLTFFDISEGHVLSLTKEDGWIKFPSAITTDIQENNFAWAKVTDSGSYDKALVVFHHWNAKSRNQRLANFLSRRGISVIEVALPYHLERRRPGSLHSDFMLSSNLGRTIQSIRQAVLDGRLLVKFLKGEGYKEISVLGMSLGSWVAGLVAAHDPDVNKAALFLSAGSLADMVWTGRATRLIRTALEPAINLTDLNRAWSIVNLENYAHLLTRPQLDVQFVLAKRDKVVLPDLSERFIRSLQHAGTTPEVLRLNCGHYSLSLPPHMIFAGLRLMKFLGRVH